MGRKSRRKGAAWEQEVARRFRQMGIAAERSLTEVRDGNTGDLDFPTGLPMVVQAKTGARPNVSSGEPADADVWARLDSAGADTCITYDGGETMEGGFIAPDKRACYGMSDNPILEGLTTNAENLLLATVEVLLLGEGAPTKPTLAQPTSETEDQFKVWPDSAFSDPEAHSFAAWQTRWREDGTVAWTEEPEILTRPTSGTPETVTATGMAGKTVEIQSREKDGTDDAYSLWSDSKFVTVAVSGAGSGGDPPDTPTISASNIRGTLVDLTSSPYSH